MPACNLVLADIAKNTCPNRAGLFELLHIADRTDVATIGAATDHSVSTITMVATKKFFKIEAVRKNTKQETTPNDNGTFDTEITYFVPYQEAVKAKIFTQFTGTTDLAIVVTQDRNGEKYIIGSKTYGAMISIKSVVSPENGYEITIKWQDHDNLPYHFTGTVPTA